NKNKQYLVKAIIFCLYQKQQHLLFLDNGCCCFSCTVFAFQELQNHFIQYFFLRPQAYQMIHFFEKNNFFFIGSYFFFQGISRTKWHYTIFMPLRNKNKRSDFFQIRLRLIHKFHKFYISPKRNVTYFSLIMFIHVIIIKFSSKTISNHFCHIITHIFKRQILTCSQ